VILNFRLTKYALEGLALKLWILC